MWTVCLTIRNVLNKLMCDFVNQLIWFHVSSVGRSQRHLHQYLIPDMQIISEGKSIVLWQCSGHGRCPSREWHVLCILHWVSSGGSRDQIFLNFMLFLEKIWQMHMLPPPLPEGCAPSYGESWIRPWSQLKWAGFFDKFAPILWPIRKAGWVGNNFFSIS